MIDVPPEGELTTEQISLCRITDGSHLAGPPQTVEINFHAGIHVPYLPPGSRELAGAVADAMKTHNLVMLQNHGQVVVAMDYAHAIQNAVFFELACEIILRAGSALVPLTPGAVQSLLTAARNAGSV